jgi:hypothetical protein
MTDSEAGSPSVGRARTTPNPVTVIAGEQGCRIFARPTYRHGDHHAEENSYATEE